MASRQVENLSNNKTDLSTLIRTGVGSKVEISLTTISLSIRMETEEAITEATEAETEEVIKVVSIEEVSVGTEVATETEAENPLTEEEDDNV